MTNPKAQQLQTASAAATINQRTEGRTMDKIVNLQANGEAVDLTPPLISNWMEKDGAAPVLIVNPVATLHQRAALAWVAASDTLRILEAVQEAGGYSRKEGGSILSVVIERMHQLEAMLSDLGDRTAAMEGGAA